MPQLSNALRCVAGDDATWTLPLTKGGQPYTSFGPGNTLAATLWQGESRAPISGVLSVAYAADYATSGNLLLSALGTASASLEPGDYDAMVDAAVGAGRRTCWRGTLEVLGAPGTATAGASYTTYAAMLAVHPDIANLINVEADGEGFGKLQAWATAQFNLALVDRYDPLPGFNRRRTEGMGAIYDPSAGWDVPDVTTIAPSESVVRVALNGAGLILDDMDALVVQEIVAKLAVARVLSRPDTGSRASNPYAQAAAEIDKSARAMLAGYEPYIDTNADATPDIKMMRNGSVIFLVGGIY